MKHYDGHESREGRYQWKSHNVLNFDDMTHKRAGLLATLLNWILCDPNANKMYNFNGCKKFH